MTTHVRATHALAGDLLRPEAPRNASPWVEKEAEGKRTDRTAKPNRWQITVLNPSYLKNYYEYRTKPIGGTSANPKTIQDWGILVLLLGKLAENTFFAASHFLLQFCWHQNQKIRTGTFCPLLSQVVPVSLICSFGILCSLRAHLGVNTWWPTCKYGKHQGNQRCGFLVYQVLFNQSQKIRIICWVVSTLNFSSSISSNDLRHRAASLAAWSQTKPAVIVLKIAISSNQNDDRHVNI